MELDALLLSRLQFALTIGFHFLFPPLSIGLAWLVVIMEWRGWKRGDEDYVRAGKFFGKILGVTFAVGVATGIVMEFQFGTNWAQYSKFVGDIFGAPLAAEAIFAFFLESTFLGLYLFGRKKVSKGMHWFSALMVAVGSTLSAFWIIVANSWQQTPAGFEIRNGRAELTSFAEAAFNASTWPRFFHTFDACLVAGAFLVAGVSAYLVVKNNAVEVARKSLRLSLIFGLIVSLLALFPTGDWHAKQVARTQPEKFAAMEGLTKGKTRAPLVVFGNPKDRPPTLSFELGIPGVLSLLAFGDVSAYVPGIEDLRKEGHPTPPFVATFVSFHTMVGLGLLFILQSLLGVFLLCRKKLVDTHWYLKLLPWVIPLPLLACEFGWIVAEVGRQPWVVYRVLKTADAYSTNVTGGEVLFSIIMFGAIYAVLGALYVYTLARIVKRGPQSLTAEEVH
ncbi:MAG: cytochrome ubiquinol oxidase subunit I [Phycisphaerales bacterium]|nr:MAG: cytochrome ubiquinol oxidase subunit I [Phycisphaerales bacterium]